MRLSGRENRAARDLCLSPLKWRSIAQQTSLCTHEKTGARWLCDSCRVPALFLCFYPRSVCRSRSGCLPACKMLSMFCLIISYSQTFFSVSHSRRKGLLSALGGLHIPIAARRAGIRKGAPFLCLLRKFLSLMPYYGAMPGFAKLTQKKTLQSSEKITTLSKPYSILTDTSYLPSVSTSAISFAVALTIRMPVSLIPSSCRRCVFFSGGVSRRNWSTEIL